MPVSNRTAMGSVAPEAQQAFFYQLQPLLKNELEAARQRMHKLMSAIVHDKWPSTRVEYGVMRYKPLSMDAAEFRNELYGAYVAYEQMHKMGTSKLAHRPMLAPEGLDARKVQAGEAFMLYWIDPESNHSKFYEGLLLSNDDGSYNVKFRWGALTDSGFTGRIDGAKFDSKFSHLDLATAKRALAIKYREKTGTGYVDAWRHKLPKGQYPVGLKRDVGFGWGVQETAFCVPSLRLVRDTLADAQDKVLKEKYQAAQQMQDAARYRVDTDLSRSDSTMGKKILSNIDHLAGRAKGIIEKSMGAWDQSDVKKEARIWATALSRLISYLDNQLSVCHGKVAGDKMANFNPKDIGAIKPPSGDPDEMHIVKDTDQRWFSQMQEQAESPTPLWDGTGEPPEGAVRKLAVRVLASRENPVAVNKLASRWLDENSQGE